MIKHINLPGVTKTYAAVCSRGDDMEETNKLNGFLNDLEAVSGNYPENVILKLKASLLDYLGVTIAGAKAFENKTKTIIENSNGDCSIIGVDATTSFENAIFVNGLHAHALDFDDGTNHGIIHLGSPIFSVLLPLSKKYQVDWNRFVNAVLRGYEASFTLAISLQPTHKSLGYHATGTCGTLGATLAISDLLEFSVSEKRNALSTAAVSATGSLKVLENDSELKPYNVAKASLMAYISATIGKAGFQGPVDAFSGYAGFLSMMVREENRCLQKPLWNGTYAIEKTYFKPYAACRYCHPAIEASLQLRKEYSINPDEIEKIDVRTYKWAVFNHDHTTVPNPASAKMSIPYSVAVSLITGKANLVEYNEEHVQNKDIIELTRKVSVSDDEKMTEDFPKLTTAVVTILMKNGVCYEKRVDFPKGEPENPLSMEEVVDKFMSMAVFANYDFKNAEKIVDIVLSAETRFDELFEFI